MNRPGILALALSLAVAAPALARGGSARARYSIELSDGTRVSAVDAPVVHGSVVTFHSADGVLTGVPREMVVRVASLDAAPLSANTIRALQAPRGATSEGVAPDATVVAPQGLQPGEVLVLGPITDSTSSIAQQAAAAGALGSGAGNGVSGGTVPNGGAAYNGAVGYGGVPSYGGAVNPNVVNPNLYIAPGVTAPGADGVPRALSSTDLERAQAAQNPIGPNGFPVMTNGAPTVVGPNGTPTLAPGVPGSGTLAIGPNGQPVLAPSGQPGSVQPGQAGSAQPVIGPNGTPVLAPSGQPGSAAPRTAPNGTPASPAPSGGAAAGSSGPGR